MSYSHFSIEERISIKHLLAKGTSIRQIAKELKRSPSSILREIKRNSGELNDCGESYTVKRAEQKHKNRVSQAHNIVQFPLEVVQIIEQRIKETWSPEQIAAFYKGQGFPCYKTIYKWINEGTIVNGNKSLLRRKGKGGWYETRGKTTKGKSIRKRDKRIYKRADYGHCSLGFKTAQLGAVLFVHLGLQAFQASADDSARVGGTVNLREDVAHTGEFENGTGSSTGDNTSTRSGRHEEDAGRTALHFDVVRDGAVEELHFDDVALGGFGALADGFGNFLGLAETHAHLAVLVAYDNESGEGHTATALDGLRATVDVYNLVFKFRNLSFAFQSVPH